MHACYIEHNYLIKINREAIIRHSVEYYFTLLYLRLLEISLDENLSRVDEYLY